MPATAVISVIVPTLNEADRIAALAATPDLASPAVETIVVDGGSADGTADRARRLGLKVMTAPRGRGQQLATGAAAAKGDILLFLHADTVLGPGALDAVRQALADATIVGGNFRLLFDGDDDFSRWLDGFYARIRRRGWYYGDSAIFMRRSRYEAIGGVRPIALMEDYDLVRRLERSGRTVCIDAPPAITSSRRFVGRKKRRIVTQWVVIHMLFWLGVPSSWLAALYNSARATPAQSGSD